MVATIFKGPPGSKRWRGCWILLQYSVADGRFFGEAFMAFAGPGKPLTQESLDEAGGIVGIPNAAMWAVIQVESAGAGYDPDRRPKILFERHLFHRATGGRFDATHPDISNRNSGGYGSGGAHQYDRLAEAIELNRTAALASASWGLGQVVGSNFAVAGFADVEDMVAKMVQSERHQLLGMFNFIKGNNLGRHLKNKDWLRFALGYNGRTAEARGYPHKLEAAFETFDEGSPPDIRVRIAQLALTFLAHKPGGVDGLFGNNSRRALQRFQVAERLPQTTELTNADFDALVAKAFGGDIDS
ncbi:MAG: N-acetylmuramidase domain-containing protein [Anaerolineales bacterium]